MHPLEELELIPLEVFMAYRRQDTNGPLARKVKLGSPIWPLWLLPEVPDVPEQEVLEVPQVPEQVRSPGSVEVPALQPKARLPTKRKPLLQRILPLNLQGLEVQETKGSLLQEPKELQKVKYTYIHI